VSDLNAALAARLGRTHLMGVGGAGMAAIAELAAAAGAPVSGCDAAASAVLDRLGAAGVATCVGHDPAHAADADTYVVTSAVRRDNPELAAARARGLTVLHRSQALAWLGEGRQVAAVAGTHGKTTTSAMLASILAGVGADPSFAIGGDILPLGTGAHLGAGPAFVIEADESDASFLRYRPRVAVVTCVEPDHLDHYGTPDAYRAAFADFAGRIEPGGELVAAADDPGGAALAAEVRATRPEIRVTTYGSAARADARLSAADQSGPDAPRAELRLPGGGAVGLRPRPPGWHNVLNAAAAVLAAAALGVDPQAAARALEDFAGTARRFEDRGRVAGVRVVDDYAHHPTEIRALMKAARQAAGEGRVLAVFQPHMFSRTRDFAPGFADALAAADRLWLLDIYKAREEPFPGVTSALIADRVPGASLAPSFDAAAAAVAAAARPGDLVLTIGAGDVTELGPMIIERLEAGA
jgi:UDP-N-acetylmuramate--alanine ligase